jgi:hypothetical protein
VPCIQQKGPRLKESERYSATRLALILAKEKQDAEKQDAEKQDAEKLSIYRFWHTLCFTSQLNLYRLEFLRIRRVLDEWHKLSKSETLASYDKQLDKSMGLYRYLAFLFYTPRFLAATGSLFWQAEGYQKACIAASFTSYVTLLVIGVMHNNAALAGAGAAVGFLSIAAMEYWATSQAKMAPTVENKEALATRWKTLSFSVFNDFCWITAGVLGFSVSHAENYFLSDDQGTYITIALYALDVANVIYHRVQQYNQYKTLGSGYEKELTEHVQKSQQEFLRALGLLIGMVMCWPGLQNEWHFAGAAFVAVVCVLDFFKFPGIARGFNWLLNKAGVKGCKPADYEKNTSSSYPERVQNIAGALSILIFAGGMPLLLTLDVHITTAVLLPLIGSAVLFGLSKWDNEKVKKFVGYEKVKKFVEKELEALFPCCSSPP